MDQLEKWQADVKEREKEGTIIIKRIKVLIHSVDGVTDAEDHNDGIVVFVDRWRKMRNGFKHNGDGHLLDFNGYNDDDEDDDDSRKYQLDPFWIRVSHFRFFV